MKKDRVKKAFLEQLRKIPIIAVSCEKIGVSRNSVYKWRNKDPSFKEEMDTALLEGEALINDMSESQLLSLIQEKNWSAISFWLRHRNPKFRERVEVTATVQSAQEELNPEQEEIVRRALRLAALIQHDKSNKQSGDVVPGHSDGDVKGS
ncbi:MAG: hypothetical protein A2918_01265 [Candidatus Yanofskybacteria bacterium RIFCSPLOWO2_01_FULL_42_49]|uniref:Homeodomain phBC6A51-type domain-containing protein n=1 Tax=Candidatus Yanofskybacteria bacterium RIFCSPLOWO2_01_FULL_42_49 TaxID=1802694 RepID=A0A1F8GCG1_9BACT|nr:MAG: hypothetical protein A2918_01265 [Candidatus Yanofskybacteria bacterium RIFCSPLOWO2_01_FULL_42_49]